MTHTEKPPGNSAEPPVQEDCTTVAERVRAAIAVRSLSQNTAAREIGISPSALSRFLSGTYGADDRVVATKAAAWLELIDQRDKLPAGMTAAARFVRTPTSDQIMGALEYAQLIGDLVLVSGVPGVGKTTAMKHYRDARTNVWLATMSPDTKTPVPMLVEIGISLGLRSLGGGAAKMRRDISERIRDTGGLLILDEAQHLGAEALETARRIFDGTGVGLVYAGDDKLWEKVSAFPQLSSRIGKRVTITTTSSADITALTAALGIEGGDERKFLGQIARTHSGLRSIAKTQRLGQLYADGEGKPLSIEHLRTAWANLNLGPVA
ncbi:MAG: AAA family ATPase [Rhodospirillaceae bacterium]